MRIVAMLVVSALFLAACGGSAGAADPERFCELLDEIDAQNTTGLPADEAVDTLRDGREKFIEAAEVAPDEIKEEVELVTDGAVQLTDLLIEAGNDESQLDSGVVEGIFTDEFDAAADSVDAWRTSNCS